MIHEPLSRRRSRAVVLGVLAGLCGIAAWYLARGPRAPVPRTPATTVRAPAHPARVAPAPDRLDLSTGDGPIPLAGTADGDGAELPDEAAMPSRPHADEHRPPPPEAIGVPQARPPGPDRDTGLVFHSEPPGDGEKSKASRSAPPAPSSGPVPPPVTTDVRPPPEPVDLAPQPARPDHDTGLVFGNQPPRPADGGGEKR
ncbi:MAG TPA: hypothetical protein VFK02_17580 [Kofleriaceae bacterium]|nr:hypothetical protein [Kofleriaceae bacterium]